MLLYHKKNNYINKLLKKTFVYLNSLEVCSVYPYIYLYIKCSPVILYLQKCVSILNKCAIVI